MRLFHLCLVVLLSTAIAGCIADEGPSTPAADAATNAIVESAYHVELEGAAGEWVFVYLPYVNATGEMEGTTEWNVRTAPTVDGAQHILWLSPTWVWEDGGRADFFAHGDTGPHVVEEGSFEDVLSSSWRLGSSPSPIGYNFAFAADAPWTMSVEVGVTSGAAGFGEPVVLRGGDVDAVMVDDDPLPVPAGSVGSYEFTGTFATDGWQYMALLGEHVQPVAVRDYLFELPGHELARTGYRYGFQAGFGSASSSNMAGGLGIFNGSAGDWRVALTYAEATWDRPTIVFGMGGVVDWPAWAEQPWHVRDRPFHDGATPPLPPIEDVWFERR